MADQDNHARDQAAAQFAHIKTLVDALRCDYDRLEELRGERDEFLHSLGMASLRDTFDMAPGVSGRFVTAEHSWRRAAGDDVVNELIDLEAQAGEFENADAASDAIHEHPLSVQVRSGWYSPGDTQDAQTPEEFEILLCTGGPAVRILGVLDEHCEPHLAWLEYQDWGTPWTMYFPEGDDADDILLTYCQQFYFGQ